MNRSYLIAIEKTLNRRGLQKENLTVMKRNLATFYDCAQVFSGYETEMT